jgi:hypothetical protein
MNKKDKDNTVYRHHKMKQIIRQIFDGLLTKNKQILEKNKLAEGYPQCCGSGMIFSDPFSDHDFQLISDPS